MQGCSPWSLLEEQAPSPASAEHCGHLSSAWCRTVLRPWFKEFRGRNKQSYCAWQAPCFFSSNEVRGHCHMEAALAPEHRPQTPPSTLPRCSATAWEVVTPSLPEDAGFPASQGEILQEPSRTPPPAVLCLILSKNKFPKMSGNEGEAAVPLPWPLTHTYLHAWLCTFGAPRVCSQKLPRRSVRSHLRAPQVSGMEGTQVTKRHWDPDRCANRSPPSQTRKLGLPGAGWPAQLWAVCEELTAIPTSTRGRWRRLCPQAQEGAPQTTVKPRAEQYLLPRPRASAGTYLSAGCLCPHLS